MITRKSFRVKTDLTCSLVTNRIKEIVRLINLSEGGAALEVDRSYSVGQLVSLTFILPRARGLPGDVVQLNARLCNLRDFDTYKSHTYIGVAFLE